MRRNVTYRSVERRNSEIAAVERDQRYWKGYDVAGRFLVKVHPKPRVTRDKKHPEDMVVYLLRFRSKTNPIYAFLKIGITNRIQDRFGFDSHRYDVETIATLRGLKRPEARKVEKRLHEMFQVWAHTPRVPLMSKGDTECFEDQQCVISRTIMVFNTFKKVMNDIGRCSSDGEQSPCKRKRGDSRPPSGTNTSH